MFKFPGVQMFLLKGDKLKCYQIIQGDITTNSMKNSNETNIQKKKIVNKHASRSIKYIWGQVDKLFSDPKQLKWKEMLNKDMLFNKSIKLKNHYYYKKVCQQFNVMLSYPIRLYFLLKKNYK